MAYMLDRLGLGYFVALFFCLFSANRLGAATEAADRDPRHDDLRGADKATRQLILIDITAKQLALQIVEYEEMAAVQDPQQQQQQPGGPGISRQGGMGDDREPEEDGTGAFFSFGALHAESWWFK
ncbi:hypothetical protein B0T26DRAFT_876245 [Lasiosphaeria miniovina]|uniref:Uncharacterized protein n=1 Tax=Lasiosphaeria miniovina TaxID=1954250 RepID=A0AA40DJK6_9PEZI|nr:uncharacterized protein B0T26DRAFT_876245 [Lasiosphaeria miniovina]KAK0703117.1 hypothetical protein B0T26DRAFT_876245 [Lasiosphaeria miniovina]